MWWVILLALVSGAVLLGWVFTRTTKGERRRSAQWNDLHARGSLFTAQLAHLRDVEGRRTASSGRRNPRARSATKAGFLWRRRAAAPRDAGETPPLPRTPA